MACRCQCTVCSAADIWGVLLNTIPLKNQHSSANGAWLVSAYVPFLAILCSFSLWSCLQLQWRPAAGLIALLLHYKKEPLGREKSSHKFGLKLSMPSKKKKKKGGNYFSILRSWGKNPTKRKASSCPKHQCHRMKYFTISDDFVLFQYS